MFPAPAIHWFVHPQSVLEYGWEEGVQEVLNEPAALCDVSSNTSGTWQAGYLASNYRTQGEQTTAQSVWLNLAKFRQFGKTVKVFGYYLRVYLVLGKILNLIGHIFRIFGKFSLLLLVQYCLSPPSHWQKSFATFGLGSSLRHLVANWKKYPCQFH